MTDNKIEPTCPIITRDDIKWTLGNWLLGDVKTEEEISLAIRAANEMEKYRVLCLKLKILVDQGLEIAFFSSLLRKDIRVVLDEMDTVDSGVQLSYERRNSVLSDSNQAQVSQEAVMNQESECDLPWS